MSGYFSERMPILQNLDRDNRELSYFLYLSKQYYHPHTGSGSSKAERILPDRNRDRVPLPRRQ